MGRCFLNYFISSKALFTSSILKSFPSKKCFYWSLLNEQKMLEDCYAVSKKLSISSWAPGVYVNRFIEEHSMASRKTREIPKKKAVIRKICWLVGIRNWGVDTNKKYCKKGIHQPASFLESLIVVDFVGYIWIIFLWKRYLLMICD